MAALARSSAQSPASATAPLSSLAGSLQQDAIYLLV